MLVCSMSVEARVETGKTYRIESVAADGRSLLTSNSSLDTGVDVVLWRHTNVPSQQWTVVGTSSQTTLRNVYSTRMLGVASITSGAKARQTGNGSSSRWQLVAVDEEANIYRIRINALYLKADASATDGTAPTLASNAQDDVELQWRFVELEPQKEFTAEMREQMMDDYIRKTVERKGANYRTFGGGGWGESEQLEVVLDAYETTGREDYLKLAKDVYSWFNQNVGTSWNRLVYTDNYHWFGHDFNDDVMWQIIATARLGLLSGTQNYIRQAKRNFDIIYDRAYIPFTGLMRWAENTGDRYGTNSCIAGPAEVAACYLGFAGCGEEYFEKARDLYAAQRYVLANNMSTGKVDDSVVWNPETQRVKSRNSWGSTYNQGTMLGAACMLYKYYGDEQYLADAKKIMQWTRSNLCDNHGVVNACQVTDGDLAGFKGILMRYVRRLVRDLGETTYAKWLTSNAMHAYCNRSTEGVTPTAWLQKGTDDNTRDDFGLSTAASAAVNVILEGDPALPYAELSKQEADGILDVNENGNENFYWNGNVDNNGNDHGRVDRNAAYDLAGRRVKAPLSRGAYVIGGHKVVLK